MYSYLLAVMVLVIPATTLAQTPDSVAPANDPSPITEPSVAAPPLALPVMSTPTSVPQALPGKIVMYRGSSVVGAGVACPIRYRGQEIIELARGKFAEWEVPAGRYILNNKSSSIEVTVEPGKSSFVRCAIKMGFWVGLADLQIVDEASFSQHASLERKTAAAVTP